MSPDEWKHKERMIIKRLEDLRRTVKRTINTGLAAQIVRRVHKLKRELVRHRRRYPQQDDYECD